MDKQLVAALLAACSVAAFAADPADPAAAAARPAYRSVFDGVPTGVVEDSVDWRKANADVAQFPRGHVDLLKWEEAQPGGAHPPEAAPRPPASAPARPEPSGRHRH